jgi:predicted ATP-dependent serine protease
MSNKNQPVVLRGVKTLDEILGTEPPQVDWVWEFWVARGYVHVLVGEPKKGKSTILYALLAAIARGEPFLGYATKSTPVLVVCPEENIISISQRCWKFDIPRDSPIYFQPLRQYQDFFLEVSKFCTVNNIGLIIIDTASGWWNIEDENDNAQVQATLNKFLAVARGTNTAVLLAHHSNRAGTSARGASSFDGAVDLIASFTTGYSINQRKLITRSRFDETPGELLADYDPDTAIYKFAGTDADNIRQATQERIRTYILSNGPSPAKAIAAELKIKEGRVPAVLSDAPWAERVGKGVRGDPFIYSVKLG